MIQPGSVVKVCDKTGIILAQCIKVLGPIKKRVAYIGDVIIVAVKHINTKKFKKMKHAKKKKFFLGTLHRGLVVRSKEQFSRSLGIYIRFDENAIVIVNKRVVPITNRIYGPILRDFVLNIHL
jgi:large subunit ribosomal protein L14